MFGLKDPNNMNDPPTDQRNHTERPVPLNLSNTQRIQNARSHMSLGQRRAALDEFFTIGESLSLWSSLDLDNDPVLEAVSLPIELNFLVEEQLFIYASWIHHVQMQLTLRLKPWSTDRETALRLTESVYEFVRYINNGNFERVRTSGYFTVIETLLKQTR